MAISPYANIFLVTTILIPTAIHAISPNRMQKTVFVKEVFRIEKLDWHFFINNSRSLKAKPKKKQNFVYYLDSHIESRASCFPRFSIILPNHLLDRLFVCVSPVSLYPWLEHI